MSLHRTPCHVELGSYLGVVTTLQKQFDDLLFAGAEPNSVLLHCYPPRLGMYPRPGERGGTFDGVIASALPLWGGSGSILTGR